MKVAVTGAAGMIGANLLRGLNAIGIDHIIAVDDLTHGAKHRNLRDARIADYFDKGEFYTRFARGDFGALDAVLHQGACSDTMEHNGQLMMALNYRCTKDLLDACQARGTRLIYASSAAVYGGSTVFRTRAAAQRVRLLQVARRPSGAAVAAGCHCASCGPALLQRVRTARAAQGPHGVGGFPP